MNKKANFEVWHLVCAIALCYPAYASAQTSAGAPATQPQSDTSIEEIVVTAQRRRENLQDVPITVQAFSAQALESSGVTNAADLARVVPGMTMPTSAGYTLPHLRGVGITAIGPGIENSVALYVDGVYRGSSSSGAIALNNIASLEVEKGPQGTLFGRNATGGLIQVLTQDPKAGPLSGSADLGYANYQTTSGDLYLTGGSELIAGDVAVKASHQNQGWGVNVATGQDVNATDLDLSVRSKWLIRPTDSTKVTVIFDYADVQFSTSALQNYGNTPNFYYPGGTLQSLSKYDVDLDSQPKRHLQDGGVSVQLDQDLGFASFVDIASYRRGTYRWNVDFDLGPNPYSTNTPDQIDKQFTEELQLLSRNQSRFTWVLGLFYYYADNGYDPQIVNFGGPAVNPLKPVTLVHNTTFQETNSVAAYGQGTLDLGFRTKLTVGARYTNEKRALDGLQIAYLNGVVPVTLANVDTSVTTHTPTWRIALDHDFTDTIHAYATYNRGFKSGGYNVTAPTLAPYSPEKLDAYEAGLKTQFFDRRVTLNTAGFYYDYSNIQVSRFINGSPQVYNGGAAQLYGLDTDLTTRITERFSVSGGFELLHTKFTNFANADFFNSCAAPYPTVCSLSATGKQLPQAPNASVTVNVDYRIPLPLGELNLDVNSSSSSGYFYAPNNEDRQGPYTLVNGSAQWANEQYQFSVWAKNITNVIIPISVNQAPTATAVAYAAPRTFGVTVGITF
jgi:outer membrane receptor protein involved in Fe transport